LLPWVPYHHQENWIQGQESQWAVAKRTETVHISRMLTIITIWLENYPLTTDTSCHLPHQWSYWSTLIPEEDKRSLLPLLLHLLQ
jgi:hypothetical protein